MVRLDSTDPRSGVLAAFREDYVVRRELGERLGGRVDKVITLAVWLVRHPHGSRLCDLAKPTPRILRKVGPQMLGACRLILEDEHLLPLVRSKPGQILQQDRVIWIRRLRQPAGHRFFGSWWWWLYLSHVWHLARYGWLIPLRVWLGSMRRQLCPGLRELFFELREHVLNLTGLRV